MIIIIGAGVAGLTAAKYLNEKGCDLLVIEASDAVGGRVRTDIVEGFTLDRGFQVFLTSYPEAKGLIDQTELDLCQLPSGAQIRIGKEFAVLPNPLKDLRTLPNALMSPIGGVLDKIQVFQLNLDTRKINDPDDVSTSRSTMEFLKTYGFSTKMIERFFLPFFRGVFLDRDLETNAALFRFLYGQFAAGDAAIPRGGMQKIPEQIASHLRPEQVRLNTRVKRVDGMTVYLENGESIKADKLIIATDAPTASKLLDKPIDINFNKTVCMYFQSDTGLKLNNPPYLMINSNKDELIDHIFPVSEAVPGSAPRGKTLISVNLAGKSDVSEPVVKDELANWFGPQMSWDHVASYSIPEALPQFKEPSELDQKINERTFICGDYTEYPSLNAAMKSGRLVAELAS